MIGTTVIEELNASGNLKIWLTVKEASECFYEFLDYFATFLLQFEIITGTRWKKVYFNLSKGKNLKRKKIKIKATGITKNLIRRTMLAY